MPAWPLPTSPVGSFNKKWMHYDGNNWNDAWNSCIYGSPTQNGADVLSNCTGWCEGRMLDLYMLFNPTYDPGTLGTHMFMDFGYHNAGQEWLDEAQAKGFTIVHEPQIGAVLVTGTHVAVIEDYNEGFGYLISESGYGDSTPWYLHYSLYKDNGIWKSSYSSDPVVLDFFLIPTVTPGPVPGTGHDRHHGHRARSSRGLII